MCELINPIVGAVNIGALSTDEHFKDGYYLLKFEPIPYTIQYEIIIDGNDVFL